MNYFLLGTPIYGFINGTVPCNAHLADLMDQVRPLLRDAVEHVNKVAELVILIWDNYSLSCLEFFFQFILNPYDSFPGQNVDHIVDSSHRRRK